MSDAPAARLVAVSVDLDAPVDYFDFYRRPGAPPSGPFLAAALDSLLELFDRLGISATFFAIGRDAADAEARRWLARAAAAGHEIANHSLTHPHAFARLPRAAKAEEIDRGRDRLEQALGVAVEGFRSPAFDVDRELIALLLDRGFLYDSSLLPSPWIEAMKWPVRWRARRWRVGLGHAGHGLGRREPHVWARRQGRLRVVPAPAPGGLFEFPLAVTPRLRVPVYGTLTQTFGAGWFRRALAALRRDGLPINYLLHAAEVAPLDAAGGGAVRVPGYARPLAERRRLLEITLSELLTDARSLTLAALARRLGGEEVPR